MLASSTHKSIHKSNDDTKKDGGLCFRADIIYDFHHFFWNILNINLMEDSSLAFGSCFFGGICFIFIVAVCVSLYRYL